MAGNVAWIKQRPGKGSNTVTCGFQIRSRPEHRVIDVLAEHAHCDAQRICAQRRLPPAHHLRVKPGGLDGMAIVVGTSRRIPLAETTKEIWDEDFAINTRSHFLFSKAGLHSSSHDEILPPGTRSGR